MKTAIKQEETVFDAARQLKDPAERKAFLDHACAGDDALRARVEELLAIKTDAENFFTEGKVALRQTVADSAAASDAAGSPPRNLAAEEQPGNRIGPYKLLQKIGEGGCGAVYMAEQEKPVRRRVALKIIKLGMDTKAVIARFEAERQALALMDHPNIARVLDAGATDAGRPYFVMELVHGIRITDYCDQNQVDTAHRLDLFVQVCHAIQHAHQKGIIHRDIKPSNILVTMHDGVPVPKVIDFGIAKATGEPLTDKTLFTVYGHFIGTPAYMSPEQAEMSGLDVDTRSDIYSLGVLLYELLTGKTPFDAKELLKSGFDEMRRTLREKEPHRPSTKLNTLQDEELTATAQHRQAEPPKLQSLLRGDLDWIVMKSLEKDRRRRYQTANGLAMDIQRHVDNEPVVARPPTRLYRFQKLVRRNQVTFAAAGAVAVALIMGLGTSTWLFFREREARKRAVAAERQQAELYRQADERSKITQARLEVNQEEFEKADALIGAMTPAQPGLEGAAVFRALGEWHALHGRWKKAAQRFAVLLELNEADDWDSSSLDLLRYGTALIESGNTNDYRRFRNAAISRFAHTTNSVAAERVIKISLLLPADEPLISRLEPLAKVAKESFTKAGPDEADAVFFSAWKAVSLALLEYRRGEYARATEWCQQCLASPDKNAARSATARVILAECNRRSDEARYQLGLGRDLIEGRFRIMTDNDRGSREQGFWFDWVFARILLNEANTLVEKSSPAVLPVSSPEVN
jgi:hypothetical protein